MTRAVAITIAGRAGEETHVITLPEMASHAHGGGNHSHVVNDPTHAHLPGVAPSAIGDSTGPRMSGVFQNLNQGVGPGGGTDGNSYTQPAATGISLQVSGAVIASEGNNNGHENVQPTVFVPYIVKLDD